MSEQADLLDDGVLWAINRVVFHPRGFALALDSKTGQFHLVGDGTEAWHFSTDDEIRLAKAPSEQSENVQFRAFEALLARARDANADKGAK